MGSRDELVKLAEEQKAQIANYENKLKDVVRAYKSVEAEKKALEIALSVLSVPKEPGERGEEATSSTSNNKNSETASTSDQLDALKQALATLTVENKKKEMAFQSDRRALIQKNEKLSAQVEKLQSSGNRESSRRLKEQIRQVEAEREQMLSEHGSILAEMQQRYAKERMHSEKMEKQITEMSTRLHEKDEQLQRNEQRLREVNKRQSTMDSEVSQWKKKAEATPTAQVLREEIKNLKVVHEEELKAMQDRYSFNGSQLNEKDGRINVLEKRIRELSEQSAESERENLRLKLQVDDLRRAMNSLNEESQHAAAPVRNYDAVVEKTGDQHVDPFEQFRELYIKLRQINAQFDVYDSLNIERPDSMSETSQQSSATLNRSVKSANKLADEPIGESTEYLQTLVRHLQLKLATLEQSHESTRREHEHTSDALRHRINDLETRLEQTRMQMSNECQAKVGEVEEELAKQRQRLLDLVSEKEEELEMTRNALSAFYAGGADPLDPPQPSHQKASTAPGNKEMKGSAESLVNNEGVSEEPPGKIVSLRRSLSQFGEHRNVFYEQELTKREQEIIELRNIARLSEMKVRDSEQSMLTKDMQYLQIVETLKEEIRILEGRLSLERSSDTNMAYLRNVFVQFVNSQNSTGRKHILKAIGAVLRLTSSEMKRIDKWNL